MALSVALPFLFPACLPAHQSHAASATAEPADDAPVAVHRHAIAAGQTLASLLREAGIDAGEATAALAALRRQADPRRLQVGQEVDLVTAANRGGAALVGLVLATAPERAVAVYRGFDGGWHAERMPRAAAAAMLESTAVTDDGNGFRLTRTFTLARGDTLMTLLAKTGAGAPDAHAAVRALSGEVNLRRLAAGQRITVTAALPESGDRTPQLVRVALDETTGVTRQGDGSFRTETAGDRPATAAPIQPVAAAALPPAAPEPAAEDGALPGIADAVPAPEAPPAALPPSPVLPADAVARQTPDAADMVPRADDAAGLVTSALTVGRGQGLLDILIRAGAAHTDAAAATMSLGELVDLRRLQIGDNVVALFRPAADGDVLVAVRVRAADGRAAGVARRADGNFVAGGPAPIPEPVPQSVPVQAVADQLEAAPIGPERPPHTDSVPAREPAVVFDSTAPAAIPEPSAVVPEARPTPEPAEVEGLEVEAPPPAAATPAAVAAPAAAPEESEPIAAVPAAVDAKPEVAAASAQGIEAIGAAAADQEAGSSFPAELHTLSIRRGDTLMKLLVKAGASQADADAAVRAMHKLVDPRKLRVGQELIIGIDVGDNRLAGLVLGLRDDRAVVVERDTAAAGYGPGFVASETRYQDVLPTELFAGTVAEPAPEVALAEPIDLSGPPSRLQQLSGVDWVERTLGRGDTLMEVLVGAGFDRADAHAAIAAMNPVFDPRRLQAGKAVALAMASNGTDTAPTLAGFSVDIDREKRIEVVRHDDGAYLPEIIAKPLLRRMVRRDGVIEHSLYSDAMGTGMSPGVLMGLVNIFSYDVDFQRDIRSGDRFELLYEEFVDEYGRVVRDGDIHYAAMTLSGKEYPLYRHTLDDGSSDFFTPDGQSVRKALLRTPIDGARLSSGFGPRRHPILGYTRMHQGIDFAAPTGTPIMAAGDGTVERASAYGAYGNYVRIRHREGYATAYAHLNGFARGITAGARVKQGQVIGYVGSTGRTTGPHLHYEVLVDGAQVNPVSVQLPTGIHLEDEELERFHAARRDAARLFASLPSTVATGMSSGQ